ncbi:MULTISPECIES: hypothetical protein [Pseudomonas]|uniref:Secreted protein n=1 Tax=Pseudomonas marincola TaxID=437900 RepID=A0A653E1H3_9PSED|nr:MULTISPECIES: hypothetical protein [Pseudomonas]MBQ55669.1 hypothetical protein [Pseudomonadaceae bacterium]OEO25778.1 hypothetical protein AX279_10095 [Pseudomonas sp. J237]CAE6952774.1 conserved exported protein of unknown function [Pseudomonas marincola]HCP53681.1 hypothetical protein [Pseudomonas sp.]|tara:strand:- start:1482 stop:1715 length:234 start_codon:yes stop_codon:yes gene_type:complete
MKILKSLIIGSVLLVGSTLTYAEDGYDRSMNAQEKFRADQKRIHGVESTAKPADDLNVNSNDQDRTETDINKQINAE